MRALGLYQGIVNHRRTRPCLHSFNYRMTQTWIDLQQLDLLDRISVFWSTRGPNIVRFKPENYFPSQASDQSDLYQRVCKQIHQQTNKDFNGKAYLLANLSYWGYCYNPIVFVCCYENDELRYLVAEVHNTPWNERFVYVHDIESTTGSIDEKGYYHAHFKKSFHVSPFMPMNLQYHWTYKIDDSRFFIDMNVLEKEQSIFNATLNLKGSPLQRHQANGIPFRFPFTCVKVMSAIYWQAFKLWLKRVPFHTHTTTK